MTHLTASEAAPRPQVGDVQEELWPDPRLLPWPGCVLERGGLAYAVQALNGDRVSFTVGRFPDLRTVSLRQWQRLMSHAKHWTARERDRR